MLQPVIMSRTVAVNPLAVLVGVLFGVELFGFLGALLAIPVAGIIQVVVRDLYDWRRASSRCRCRARRQGAGGRAAESPRHVPDPVVGSLAPDQRRTGGHNRRLVAARMTSPPRA